MSTVLIVDDSKFMRDMLRKILTADGHTIIGEASNGQQGFEEYKKLQPEIVTMDITMDDVDGMEGLRMIREYDPNAAIVMCTAMGQQCLVVEAIHLGAKEFVVKPFTEDKIRNAIKKVLRG